MLEKIKKLGNKKFIIDFAILLILIVLIFVFFKNNITSLEKIKLEEKSSEISDYFEEIVDSEGKDKYLNFAIEYLYNTKDTDEFTINEILEVINSNFDLAYTEKDILDVGTTNNMLNKNIVYDAALNGYRYSNDITISDIANKQVSYFKINKMTKINEKKFKIVYDKYIIENPYEVLNYYNNYNIENPEDKIDTTVVVEYLKGNEKVGAFKDVVRNENKTNFGKKSGKIEVTYIIKNNKLVVDKIK